MPSREDRSLFLPVPSEMHLPVVAPADGVHLATRGTSTTTQDFLSRDIENLVSEIKENLRLSGFKSRHQRRVVRPSPYSNPSRSLSDVCCESCKGSDDFLNDGSGAKTTTKCPHHTTSTTTAAACRTTTLNLGVKTTSNTYPDDPYLMLQELLRGGDLIKEAVRRLGNLSSKQRRYCYDSDDESSRTPLHLCKNVEV